MNKQITIHQDLVQGTTAWHNLRLGRIGGSECSVLTVNGKGPGGLGAGAITLAYKKAAEILTGEPADSLYESDAMARGSELEPEAREAYERKFKTIVAPCGYVEHTKHSGFSPDGILEGGKGVLEIKCPLMPEYLRYAHTREIKKEHYHQLQWGMWILGADIGEYVVYYPGYPVTRSRMGANPPLYNLFEQRLSAFTELVEEIIEGAKQ